MTGRREFLAVVPGLLLAKPEDVNVQTLLKQPIADVINGQGYVQVVTLAPGAKSGAHRHPGPVFAYVVD